MFEAPDWIAREKGRCMGRPKKHTIPYCGDREQMEKVFQEYLDCVVDCFGAPYDDREATAENASLRSVCEEFGI